jgi:hypothetical protein
MTPVNVSPSRPVEGGHVVYAGNQPEYQPLPAWRKPDGEVVSRWRLTWQERLAALLGRTLYIEVLTFNQPLQPVFLTFSEDEALYEGGTPE